MSFRYYIYVSDTKVNMLLSQISPSFHGNERLSGASFQDIRRQEGT